MSAIFLCSDIESFYAEIQFLDKIIEKLDFDIEIFDNFIKADDVGIERLDVGAGLFIDYNTPQRGLAA